MTAKGSGAEVLEGGWGSLRFVLLETLLPLVLKVPRRLCTKAHDWSSSSGLFPPRPRPGLAPVAIAAIVGVGLAVFALAVALLDHLAIGRVLAGLVEDLFHEQAEGARRLLGRRRTVAGSSLAAWARASAF